MENEIWKDVPGYAGIYQVSNLGRVKSLQRVISRENGWKQTINERFRSNNNVSNLRWVTRLENNNNPITLSKLKLSARVISKPVLQLKNGVIVKEYNSINEADKINGFSPIAICKVCKGERKNHKGYMWRYKNEKA